MKKVMIHTEYIKLDQFLKWAEVVTSGIEAKMFILDGNVLVNNVTEIRRGRKLRKGDVVKANSQEFVIDSDYVGVTE